MTRMHTAAAGLAAAALLFAGAAQAQQAITWWYEDANPEQRQFIADELVTPFEADNPDWRVQIDYRGSELDRQLRIAMLAGQGPDIVYTAGPSYVAGMAQAGQLLPLDDYVTAFGWDERILPVFLDLGTYDGTLYALTKTYETMGLFYNKTLFEEHGWEVPVTIAEIEALADEMLEAGIIPFGAGNADWRPANEHYVSIVLNNVAGPDTIYRALIGEIPWTDPAIVEAIETLNQWWQRGYFGPDYFSLTGEEAFSLLATREAGMVPTGTWRFQSVETFFDPIDDEIGFVAFPSAEGVDYPLYPLGIGSTFSIAATSEVPDGAAAVIDYVFTEDFYGRMNAVWQGEWNTPLSDLSGIDPDAGVDPLYIEAMDALADAVDEGGYGYTTWTFLPPATNTYQWTAIEEVWLGQITAEQYLETLDATFQEDMAEGRVPAIPAR